MTPIFKKCRHPRTPDNMITSGPGGYSCRTCKAVYNKRYRDSQYLRPAPLPPRVALDYSQEPALLLYRATKEARALRPDPRLSEAKRQWDEQMEREKTLRKGGRPPKPRRKQA